MNISKILVKNIEDLTYLKLLLNEIHRNFLKEGYKGLKPLLQVFNIINYLRFIVKYLKMFRFYSLFYNMIKILALLCIIFSIFILYLFSDYNTDYLDNFINQKYIVEIISEYFINILNKISEFFNINTNKEVLKEIPETYKAIIEILDNKSNTTDNLIYYGTLAVLIIVLGGLLYVYSKDYFNNFNDLTPPNSPNNDTNLINNIIDIKGKAKAPNTPISNVDSIDFYLPNTDPQSSTTYTYGKFIKSNENSRILPQLPNKNELNISMLSSNMQSKLNVMEKVNSPTNSISSIDSNKTIK